MAKRNPSTAAAMEDVPSTPFPPPVFIDTNLDTHLALIVSPDDTVADLKRKVSLEHVVCFPSIGGVTVHSIKVRRKATYYYLPDSMLVRTAFDGIKRTWFLHMDVAPVDNDGDVAGGEANKTKWAIAGGLLSVDVPVKADSSMMMNDPSYPGCSLMPSVSGQNQLPRLELPSGDVLLSSDLHGEASKDTSWTVPPSHKSENSALELGDRTHVDNSESHKSFLETKRVSSSDFELARHVDQLNKDVNGKDSENLVVAVNDGNASTVAAEKSRKRSMKLEDGRLLRSPSEKKRHKKEEKKNAASCKDHGKDLLEVIETGNVGKENIARDHVVGSISLLDDVSSQLLKDDSILPQELPYEKKKSKRKRRKVADECHNEIDVGECPNASNKQKNSALGTGLSEHTSNENDLVLGEKTVDKEEKIFPTSDNNEGPISALELPNEKPAESSINEHHVEMDSGVPAKENKRSSRQRKKKVTKGELCGSELDNTEIIHPVGKWNNGENPEEVQAHDPKHLLTELNMEIVSKEASRLENAIAIVPEALIGDGKILGSSKKRSRKAASSKIKSSNDGVLSSATNTEETSVVSGNFIETDRSTPNTFNFFTHCKKKSVKAKEYSTEAPHEVDPPIAGPPSLVEQLSMVKHAEASNGEATSDTAFAPKTTQQGLMNTEGGHITKKSSGKKVQGDSVNHGFCEPPHDPSTKQKSKSHKHKAADKPHGPQKDGGRGNSNLTHAETSSHLQPSESSQDHQIDENHNQDIFTGNEFEKPTHHAEEKGSLDHLGANSHSVQQKTGSNSGNSMKQMNASPAASDDNTEEDTPFNEKLYRVVAREKVSNSRSKKDLNKSKQEVFLNAADNIFGHSTSTSSEDEVEGHNEKEANNTVSGTLTSGDSEEDLEQTQVVIGPKAQKNTSTRGMSPSSARLLPNKEASDEDILQSQPAVTTRHRRLVATTTVDGGGDGDGYLGRTSNAAKKRVKLGVLLRGSHSYRKAKLTALSQTDDTETQPVEVVPETQSDFP